MVISYQYAQYIIRNLATAENALFEARNACMGTGVERYDRITRELDKMRVRVATLALDEVKRAVK